MSLITVLGIGNRLMCDDGVGVYVVEDLMKRCWNRELDFVSGETDTDYCIDAVRTAERLIIVDAVISGRKPGEISVYPLDENIAAASCSLSQHQIHLVHAIRHRKQPADGMLIGVEPGELRFGVGLSLELVQLYPYIVEGVSEILKHFLLHDKKTAH